LAAIFHFVPQSWNMPSEARRMADKVRTGVHPLSFHDAQGMPQPGHGIDEQQELHGPEKNSI
jgi:hypothetical protein